MNPRHTCRACGSRNLKLILSFGRLPLANALLQSGQLNQPEQTHPLSLAFCPDCSLTQIRETISPEKLFREYVYYSSFSDTMLAHSRQLVERLILTRRLGGDALIVEIGSNDGYLLQYYASKGIPVLGIEPATNVAKVAERERGIPTLCEFFSENLARRLVKRGKRAGVLHANNVLAHVANLGGFVDGMRLLLKKEGVAIVEVPYVRELVDKCEFDTIYHEHLCYFSLTSLNYLFSRHGLAIQDVERIAIHGGSLRVYVVRDDSKAKGREVPKQVRDLLNEEVGCGVNRFEYYQDFAAEVARLKSSMVSLLTHLKQEGNRIVAYGAAAKGTMLLNYFGIGREVIDFVVDRNAHKQGLYMPGTHLEIRAPESLLEALPDYVLLLSWNLADEIINQQEEYRRRGGRFIVPVPEVRII